METTFLNMPRGAILQRDKKTYAIVPRIPAGLVTPEILEKIASVARKHNIPILKITSGQRIAMVGMTAEQVEPIWEDLGLDPGKAVELCVHYVQACPGTTVCKFGLQDSLSLAQKLEQHFVGKELPAKAKMGVSGCPFCCAESYVRDVGIIGTKKGWTVAFGGHSGAKPRVADVLKRDLEEKEVIDLVERALNYFWEHGKNNIRAARFVEKVGIREIKAGLGLE
ncbi:MAG: NAD(P)/FAD-dependent oxidoreductase [Pseudomonadota bacterium]